jgi:hypothetical protein
MNNSCKIAAGRSPERFFRNYGFAGQAKLSVYDAVFFFSCADPSSREDAGNPSMTREIALPRKNIADRSAISNFMI